MRRKGGRVNTTTRQIQIHVEYETGPTHAQLARMTRRRGYTTVSVVKLRELECIQWSPLQGNVVRTAVGPMSEVRS
jgi:hypothetical protein